MTSELADYEHRDLPHISMDRAASQQPRSRLWYPFPHVLRHDPRHLLMAMRTSQTGISQPRLAMLLRTPFAHPEKPRSTKSFPESMEEGFHESSTALGVFTTYSIPLSTGLRRPSVMITAISMIRSRDKSRPVISQSTWKSVVKVRQSNPSLGRDSNPDERSIIVCQRDIGHIWRSHRQGWTERK